MDSTFYPQQRQSGAKRFMNKLKFKRAGGNAPVYATNSAPVAAILHRRRGRKLKRSYHEYQDTITTTTTEAAEDTCIPTRATTITQELPLEDTIINPFGPVVLPRNTLL
eukprot:Phypoly_transcript_24189.p1 GENE.Phypoly_transcript_24189~~Phypoly_transcript_24189.p1  ORF type:complete len:109 (+),score=15.17 Phypoly_transcript_24189:178-504(+)